MADTDWARIAVEAVGWAGSSLIGLVVGAWRGGKKSAKHEQSVKDDYDAKINALRDETRTSMAAYEKQADYRNDLLITQFKESFEGIRRQIDDNRLQTEKDFLRKDAFGEFRQEYREDQRRTNDKLDRLLETRQ